MSGRSKGHAEIASARSRFGATLQCVVDKKEENLAESDGEGSVSHDLGSLSPALTPKKGLTRSNRKRKKKENSESETGNHVQTYVMKLFDRNVDMAQFDDSSPLYPMCRAWMRNAPHENRNTSPSPEPEPQPVTDEGGYPYLYSLPNPVKAEKNVDLRIPPPPPKGPLSLDIHADPDKAPSPQTLLLNHMSRWKKEREKWKKAAAANEARFVGSMQLLKDMYERNLKDN